MSKEEKSKKIKYTSFMIVGILLIIVLGILTAGFLLKGKDGLSLFSQLDTSERITIKYNHNLFDADRYSNKVITGYHQDLQIVTMNGTMEVTGIALGKNMNIKLNKGEKYRIAVNYVGGSYEKAEGVVPRFVFEFQKDGKNNPNRKWGVHYIDGILPTKDNKALEKIITITDDNVDTNNFYYWLWQKKSNGVTFNNYRIQVYITKVDEKEVSKNGLYTGMPTPEKDGYEFLGWYDKLNGGNKMESTTPITKKYTHTLYAHWKKKEANYNKFKWTYYDRKTGPISEYYKDSYPYALWAPEKLSDLNGVSLPLIVWLHGAGEMREHNCLENCFLNNGLPLIVSEWKDTGLKPIPAIIFAPQLDATDWWDERAGATIRKGIEYLKNTYNINTNKVVLMGHSSGGSGVVYISRKNQDLFSDLVIMSGFEGFNENKNYYKSISLRGYMTLNSERAPYGDGNCGMQNAFNQIGRSSDLILLPKSVSHVDVPKESLIIDENKDGVSDLIYWLFKDDAK